MIELSRFEQMRPAQRIAEEEKRLVGLSLYPDDRLSDFANSLREAPDAATYREHLLAHATTLSDLESVDPAIRSLYEWLQFKARPIKTADLQLELEKLQPGREFRLDDQWRRYADSLILAIEAHLLQKNYCIDLQLIIRICHLLRLCSNTEGESPLFELPDGATDGLLSTILARPILLPTGILRGRCHEECRKRSQMQVPTAMYASVLGERAEHECECHCDDSCQAPSQHCMCIKPYIADLFTIKEAVARFEVGEIADIENVLAGEKKIRRHRLLTRSETSTETESETLSTEERDHQVSEKHTLQNEVKNTVDAKTNVDAGVTSTLKYGTAVTITPHANVTADSSKSTSQSIARSYARDVVDRSVLKVQEKVRKVQLSKLINEVEEKNRHSIENAESSAENRAGIYYWVDKVTHAQVFNHGRHMMFDMVLPEPAAMFKKLSKIKSEEDRSDRMPPKPSITPLSIQRGNYGEYLLQYSISTTDPIAPPDPSVGVEMAFSQNVSEPADSEKSVAFSSSEFKSPEIPKGYRAKSIYFDIRCATGHPKSTGPIDEVAVSVNIGDSCLLDMTLNEWVQGSSTNQNWVESGTRQMHGEEGTLTLAVAGFSSLALAISGSISITCELKGEVYEEWQTGIYNLLMADYARKLEAYYASQNDDDQLVEIKGRNPFLNREIERNEFKRHISAALMCNYFNGIGSMMERVAPCGYPEIDFEKLSRDAYAIQFFEQVFEWEYMTYLFYHSMWARKCKWPDLISADSGDPLFDKFLTAGAARVQVPIRTGMEDVFCWFLKTGQLWGATGTPPIFGDDEYVSMIQELRESKQCDYSDRPGLIEATEGSDVLILTDSTFYWDLINDTANSLNINNDANREILVNYKVYRIVRVEQSNAVNNSAWRITINKPYPDRSERNLSHAVGALFVGSPWEVVVPTQLVYLRNPQDALPVYPLA